MSRLAIEGGTPVRTRPFPEYRTIGVEEKAVEGAKATDKAIRTHPYESLGVAFGVGLLVGVLVARR